MKNKPPSKYQKEQLKFFGQKLPKMMTTTEAKKLIKQLMEVPDNAVKWEAYKEEQQAEWDLFDEVNDCPEDYDCKKIRKNRFQEVLGDLKTEGHTAISLWDGDTNIFYDNALDMFPELAIASGGRAASTTSTHRSYAKPKSSSGCSSVVVLVMAGLAWIFWNTFA